MDRDYAPCVACSVGWMQGSTRQWSRSDIGSSGDGDPRYKRRDGCAVARAASRDDSKAAADGIIGLSDSSKHLLCSSSF